MTGVAQAYDLAIVEVVVLPKLSDAARRRPEADVGKRLERHRDPRRDHEAHRQAVRHDDLMRTVAGQDLLHRGVDPPGTRPLRLRAGHTLVMVQPFPDGGRRYEALVEPLLGSALGLAVRLLAQPMVEDRLDAQPLADDDSGLVGALQ